MAVEPFGDGAIALGWQDEIAGDREVPEGSAEDSDRARSGSDRDPVFGNVVPQNWSAQNSTSGNLVFQNSISENSISKNSNSRNSKNLDVQDSNERSQSCSQTPTTNSQNSNPKNCHSQNRNFAVLNSQIPVSKTLNSQNPQFQNPQFQNPHSAPPVWSLYALGGGLGHFTRALALGRVAARSRPVRILASDRYRGFLEPRLAGAIGDAEAAARLRVDWLPASDDLEAIRRAARRWLWQVPDACAIADTFPRGLLGELATALPQFPGPKILVHRSLNPAYVQAFALAEFVRETYDRVLVPADCLPPELADGPRAIATAPWLLRDAPGERLRDRPPERALEIAILAGASPPAEAGFFAAAARAIAAACPDATLRYFAIAPPPGNLVRFWEPAYPAIDHLGDCDLALGGGGYNTVAECLALGLPLLARPFPRRYDRQDCRVAAAAARHPGAIVPVATPEAAAAAALARWHADRAGKAPGERLRNSPRETLRERLPFVNGAAAAVAAVESWLALRKPPAIPPPGPPPADRP